MRIVKTKQKVFDLGEFEYKPGTKRFEEELEKHKRLGYNLLSDETNAFSRSAYMENGFGESIEIYAEF